MLKLMDMFFEQPELKPQPKPAPAEIPSQYPVTLTFQGEAPGRPRFWLESEDGTIEATYFSVREFKAKGKVINTLAADLAKLVKVENLAQGELMPAATTWGYE
jgi:hypothetical protein